MENNFVMKPSGPIWGKLCEKYGFVKDKAMNAYRLVMNTNDPNISTQMHYAFATYRTDDSWRGFPVNRYEIQPILDTSRLPGFHYLSYQDTLTAILLLEQEGEAKDCFLTPDFFLPTRNIKHLLESSAYIFTEDMESISSLVGVSCEDIQMYLDHLKEKKKLKTERKKISEKFKGTPLGVLNMKQLKYVLHTQLGFQEHPDRKLKTDILAEVHKEIARKNLSEKEVDALVKCCLLQKI